MRESLGKHTVKSYDQDLKSVISTIYEALDLVLVSIDMVAKIIENHPESNEDFLSEIVKHDYKVNALDSLVERKVISILALRQPMAVDLRYIVSSIKVSSNLERMGDQCKNIIKKITLIAKRKFDDDIKKALLSMIEISKTMVQDAVHAFNEQDLASAEKALKTDDMIDDIYRNLFKILECESFSKDEAKYVINVLFIAKSFERFADHSTNIADIAKYVITSETK